MSRTRRAAIVAVAAALVVACSPSGTAGVVERFDLSRVEVRLSFEPGGDDRGTVVAAFVPTESGLHLYGTDLPTGGIEGVGRPTRVDVVDTAWAASGEPVPSVEAEEQALPGFDEPFQVYPDGEVTIRLPVERRATRDADIDVEVTFMACRETLCFKPVVGHRIAVPVG